jgi:hypothetical protein
VTGQDLGEGGTVVTYTLQALSDQASLISDHSRLYFDSIPTAFSEQASLWSSTIPICIVHSILQAIFDRISF